MQSRGLRTAWHGTAAALAAAAALGGCAATTASVVPAPQAPVCQPTQTALLLWAPQWRPDQKDVPERERAAEAGAARLLAPGACFARAELQRGSTLSQDEVRARAQAAATPFDQVITVRVRELGPVLKLLSSPMGVEGGTEVDLEIAQYRGSDAAFVRRFTVHWAHGGPGVVKGVATLPDDMAAALAAGLQPAAAPR